TLQHALALVEEIGVAELATLGITRAYATRHGAGPLPTSDACLQARLKDSGNPQNPWQGGIRFGWLDLVLLRYAAGVAGGQLDGVVVNGLDQLRNIDAKVCVSYRDPEGKVLDELQIPSIPCLAAQEKSTALLQQVIPIYEAASAAEICRRVAHDCASV